jgi:hypothetical protein
MEAKVKREARMRRHVRVRKKVRAATTWARLAVNIQRVIVSRAGGTPGL